MSTAQTSWSPPTRNHNGGVLPHWIKPNESTRVPLRHVILDTEGRRERTSSGEIQTWRCAVIACLTAQQNGSWTRVVTKHRDALSLWLCVTAFTRAKRRTVLWAHNLSYDMRISGMFTYLPALGWQVRDLRLGPGGAWICWTSGGRTLTCVDSTSVWPVPLATLATSMGMTKLAAPAADDNAGWLRRCDADVRILGRVVTSTWTGCGARIWGAGR